MTSPSAGIDDFQAQADKISDSEQKQKVLDQSKTTHFSLVGRHADPVNLQCSRRTC